MKEPRHHAKNVIGVAWYRKEQWDTLKMVTDQPEAIEDTYEEWFENAKEMKKKLELSGITVNEVDIDLGDVLNWCRNKHVSVNSNSIAEYVAFRLRELDK
jgi:hypothetical protein